MRGTYCVGVVTEQSNIDYALVERCARVVVDTRNALAKARHHGEEQ